ncbi:ubiquinone biosynthesis O-methyltransferase, mitochondrial-like [Planococcus citri]|uniref:ubiquinone biosynthesis O-methyltransferase, mitochondrial-like n=1 Tax=Planococcus citri TaxID=170843 RepID=UPI0031F9E7CF
MLMVRKFWRNFKHGYYPKYLQNHLFDVVESYNNSFDPTEIQWNSYYLERYWEKESRLCRVHWLHSMNNVRIPAIYETYFTPNHLTDYTKLKPREEFKKMKILDIGCGGGICSEALARLDFNVTGIDPDPHMIFVAELHAKEIPEMKGKQLKYIKTTVDDFHEENRGKYDAIVISEVLERLPHNKKRKFLEKCINCLKIDGDVFITTRNKTFSSLYRIFVFGLSNRCEFYYHVWSRGISTYLLKTHLTSCGCDVKHVKGLQYDGEDRSFRFTDDLDEWYFVHAVKKRLII